MTTKNFDDKELFQARLDILSRTVALGGDLEGYLASLGLPVGSLTWSNRTTLVGSCPVHRGHNPTAFQVYLNDEDEDDKAPLVWRCYSGHCHERYGANLIGLTMGLLGTEEFRKALGRLLSWAGKWASLEDVQVDEEALDKRTFFPSSGSCPQQKTEAS